MHFTLLILGLTNLAIAKPFSPLIDYDRYAPLKPGITWSQCTINPLLQCGEFDVPLDYANQAAGKATLKVVRYQTSKRPKLGTLFTNPGGPGHSGVESLQRNYPKLTTVTNDFYDIVSWDPRGVGASRPRIQCAKSSPEAASILGEGIEAHGDLTKKEDRESFLAQWPAVDKELKTMGEQCRKDNGDILTYIGTTAVVRDMVALHEYLEPNATEINYWGFSYGSAIGSYFINMFPDRVGRVILDGVIDPVQWATEPSYKAWATQLSSSDGAFNGFTETCAEAGPKECELTEAGWTSAMVKARVEKLIEDAYNYRKAKPDNDLPGRGSSFIRNKIFDGMYWPVAWGSFATELKACENFYATHDYKYWNICSSVGLLLLQDPMPYDPIVGITCADAVDTVGVTTKTVFDELLNVADHVSHMFGPTLLSPGVHCHAWPARAVERFTGPWNNTLSNRILVIGNEHDPITPLVSAQRVVDMLGDSAVLVERKHWGHTSITMHSTCTEEVIRDYLLHNKIPDGSENRIKVCGTDEKIFGRIIKDISSGYPKDDPSHYSADSQSGFTSSGPKTRWSSLALLAPIFAIGFLLASISVANSLTRYKRRCKRETLFDTRMVTKQGVVTSYGATGGSSIKTGEPVF